MNNRQFFIKLFYIIGIVFLFNCLNCRTDTTSLEKGKDECNPLNYVDTTRTYFYYYFDEKIYLTLATDLFYAMFDSSIEHEVAEENFRQYAIINLGKLRYSNSYLLKPPKGRRAEEFYTFYGYDTDCGFGNQSTVEYATPVFWTNPGIDSSIIVATDKFHLRIDTLKMTENDLINFCSRYNVIIREKSPYNETRFKLSVTKSSPLNSFDMANLFQDSLDVLFAAPSFFELRAQHNFYKGEYINEY